MFRSGAIRAGSKIKAVYKRLPGIGLRVAARIAIHNGNLIKAEDILRLAIERDPTNTTLLFTRMDVRKRLGDEAGAARDESRIRELDKEAERLGWLS